MSEMGIRHFDGLPMTSGLPPDADVVTAGRHVSNVPIGDIGHSYIWRLARPYSRRAIASRAGHLS